MAILTDSIIIRDAVTADADAISKLIVQVASLQLREEFTAEGWELFLQLIAKQTLRGLIQDSTFRYWVAAITTKAQTPKEELLSLQLTYSASGDTTEWQPEVSEQNDATGNGKIIGVICSKDVFHLFHFFINPRYQRQGLGRRMWQHYLTQLPHRIGTPIKVKASDFARGFYNKLGFQATGDHTLKNGLVYTPMEFISGGPNDSTQL